MARRSAEPSLRIDLIGKVMQVFRVESWSASWRQRGKVSGERGWGGGERFREKTESHRKFPSRPDRYIRRRALSGTGNRMIPRGDATREAGEKASRVVLIS